MQHLPFPVSDADDDAVLKKLAKKLEWKPHLDEWIEAYKTYRKESGNPFKVIAKDFGPGVADQQYDLYDTRRKSGELYRMRRKKGLLSCPVCGSPVTGSLDHYLPRTVYPEFSIMRTNLIPACTHCNSGVKGSTVHGAAPRRFIHPYFDLWAADELWSVTIGPPYAAPTFRPTPSPHLSNPNDEIVDFHLENVLGEQFYLSMANGFSTYSAQILAREAKPDSAYVRKHVQDDLRVAIVSLGKNSWQAAFLRGLLSNQDAQDDVLQRALAVAPAK